MSEKKENKKLNIILLIVLGILIVAIVVTLVILRNVNTKNRRAFNAEMQAICEEHSVSISEDGTQYTVKIPASTWDALSDDSKQTFCDVVASDITTCAWSHHIIEEPFLPIVFFYSNDVYIAGGTAGNIELN